MVKKHFSPVKIEKKEDQPRNLIPAKMNKFRGFWESF